MASASHAYFHPPRQSRSDVRELIPEFFFLPDFLTNANKLELGTRQESGSGIDNVELPTWAKGDPRLFVEKHREVRRTRIQRLLSSADPRSVGS